MRVALLEASHWHVPLYLDALEAPGIEVVAVSDAEHAKGEEIAARFGCPLYDSCEQLLAAKRRSTSLLPSAGTPRCRRSAKLSSSARFRLRWKSPAACSMAQVTRLRKLAEAANVYCAVPFIFRISDFLSVLRDVEGRIPSDFNYMSFRFIVGPPSRYKAAGAGLGARSRRSPAVDPRSTSRRISSTSSGC